MQLIAIAHGSIPLLSKKEDVLAIAALIDQINSQQSTELKEVK